MRRLPSACGVVLTLVAVACPLDAGAQETAGRVTFRQERLSAGTLVHAFDDQQIAMLEKINRADRRHLERLGSVTVPDVWVADERSYSPLPLSYEAAREMPKVLAVSLAAQAFGAYEYGELPGLSCLRAPRPAREPRLHPHARARRHVGVPLG